MARARNIKPAFFQNDRLGELPPLARLLFIGLWTLADYRGCVEVRARRIKAQLLPYDDCSDNDIGVYLTALERSGFIASYTVEGTDYLKIVNFAKHQNPHKNERASGTTLPDIDDKRRQIKTLAQDGTALEQDGTARADSPILIPDSPIPLPDSRFPHPNPVAPPPAAREVAARPPKKPAVTASTWDAYSFAYERRYRSAPVRNAVVNGRLANLVARLGADAPAVAAFYVTLDNAYYGRMGHDVGTLLRDAESLRTQWATGNRITHHKTLAADRASTTYDAFAQLLEEAGHPN